MDLYINPQQEKITMPGGGFNKNADSLSQARAIMGLPTETKQGDLNNGKYNYKV